MGVGGELHGPRIGLTSPLFDTCFKILQRPANEVDRMSCTFYILDKRGTDGVVGGSDVH